MTARSRYNDSVPNPQTTQTIAPALSLCWRELVRFLRQRNRIIGALATPILFWLLIGVGMGRNFSAGATPDGSDYMRYFFPGTVIMILLFTALFSTISIIEDRSEGFLQSVLVAPVSRMAIVLGKLLGGTILAFGQGMLFLLLAPLIGVQFSVASFLMACLFLIVVSFALTGMGFCIAWRMSSTQGFHAIMNLFLMPMWFLSGAIFPAKGALKWVMGLNPLTYGLAGLRQAMYLGSFQHPADVFMPGLLVCGLVSLLFAAAMFGLASLIAGGRVAADLQ
jgi:ABC-2 type transport system permease protein